MIDLWWSEAERNGVLPLDDRGIELFGARFRDHSPHPPSRQYRYRPPMSPIPAQATAAIGGRNFELSASITRTSGENGVIFATGTENSGISLFVENDRLVLDYNAFGDHTVIESDREIPEGTSEVGLKVERSGDRGAVAQLVIAGEPTGRAEIPFYMRIISSVGASVGYDYASAVSPRYRAPNAFQGTLHEVVIQLAKGRPADAAAEARAAMASQ